MGRSAGQDDDRLVGVVLIQIDISLRLLIEERSVDSGHAWERPCGKITSDGTHCRRSIRTEYDPCLPVSMDQVKAHFRR